MKNSRFVQPRRPPSTVGGPYSSTIVKNSHSSSSSSRGNEEEYIALVPTVSSGASSTGDDCGYPSSSTTGEASLSKPNNKNKHQIIDTSSHEVDSSKEQSGESNETSIEEVIIGLDHSFKASRWNQSHSSGGNSVTGSILSATGSFGAEDEKKNDYYENASMPLQVFEDISPNSVQSVTGVWEVRSRSGDSIGDLRRASNVSDCDDYSGITEVYNEWDMDEGFAKKSTTAVTASSNAQQQQPMLMSSSPTSEDGFDDHHFPEVDHHKYRMLQSALPAPLSAFRKPSAASLATASTKNKQPTKSSEINWKLVAFWLAVIVCWLKLASGLRFFGLQEHPADSEPAPIELYRLVLGLNHEL